MKFMRRPDLDAQSRIQIVMQAWLNQGVYGKMTQLAQSYQISRTFLYQLLFVANLHLEMLFSDDKLRVYHEQRYVDQLIVLLRLEGKCSIPSLSAILKALQYQPNSVGYLSEWLHRCGRCLPSTLSTGSKTVVFYLSDEIFAIHRPILPPLARAAPAAAAARHQPPGLAVPCGAGLLPAGLAGRWRTGVAWAGCWETPAGGRQDRGAGRGGAGGGKGRLNLGFFAYRPENHHSRIHG